MIGEIIEVNEKELSIKLAFDVRKTKSILNSFVLIKDACEFIGEITRVAEGIARVKLIGEYKNGKVVIGVEKNPSFSGKAYFISRDFVPNILGMDSGKGTIVFGKSSKYDTEVNVSLDSFFGSHFAIFGSTGSGKSCGISRIVQNIFSVNPPKSSRILLFDAYGEYRNAFSKFAPGVYKQYITDVKGDGELLKIPLWLLSTDDLAILLSANKSSQILVIEKALRFVNVFIRDDEQAQAYKNSIIARALLEILSSGREPGRLRDQVLAILARYNTVDLNADTKIVQPGYIRTLKQCMAIDQSGKMSDVELVENRLTDFVIENMDLSLPDGSIKYTLSNLLDALDFALIEEGVWKSEETYDAINFLKIRLQNIINNESAKYFDVDYIDRTNFIEGLFKNGDESKCQIVNFNIDSIDDRFAKKIVKIYSRLVFDYAKESLVRAERPINIILEEAHRYVQNDTDIEIIGYNIFERICKEGRKYGVLIGFISQRPSELSETCISQCSNYLIFKMNHVKDLDFIRGSVPHMTEENIKRIQVLSSGTLLAVGKSFKMPIEVDLEMPNPAPSSDNAKVYEAWYRM